MNITDTIKFLQSGKDVDAQMKAFEELNASVTPSDLAVLLTGLESKTSDFWVRELLAEPIIRLSGPKALPHLMKALRKNYEDGHDNDSFETFLIELAESNPEGVRAELQNLAATAGKGETEDINWLLEYCR